MKFVALIFAILAIVPQALKGMALGLAKFNKCTLPARECLIGDNDQSHILNLLYGPSFWTTKGLVIGAVGLVISLVVMRILTSIETRRITGLVDKADRRSGLGHDVGAATRQRDGRDGRMPRPPGFDRNGRPRD